ncbi:MAG: AAA family ATPase, partial [Bifidobacteriaceae bacterium]|nr:AAA family ATPase [Bifidobacteriaceae bacterium]
MSLETPQKLPVSVQSFKVVREQDYKYVDKTHKMYALAHDQSNMIFLSRPRRFGKSMMLSTLEEYFKGNHELFRGLAADQLEPPESEGGWKEHIVFHFDFASGVFQNNGINELHDNINNTFSDVVRKHNLELPKIHSLTAKFQNLINQAAEKSGLPVVILFDEYDQPLNQNLMDYDKLQPLRNEMRAFFSILKTASENIRFAMLTGVTKFSGVTLFSGVN